MGHRRDFRETKQPGVATLEHTVIGNRKVVEMGLNVCSLGQMWVIGGGRTIEMW